MFNEIKNRYISKVLYLVRKIVAEIICRNNFVCDVVIVNLLRFAISNKRFVRVITVLQSQLNYGHMAVVR